MKDTQEMVGVLSAPVTRTVGFIHQGERLLDLPRLANLCLVRREEQAERVRLGVEALNNS